MRILIPHVRGGLKSETRAWGESHGAEFVDLSGDDEAYYNLLAELWSAGEAFMVVEHDIIPPDNAIEGLARCSRPWCFHPYVYVPELNWRADGVPLGCTRFSARLLRRHPDLMGDDLGRWQFLDTFAQEEGPRGWRLLSQRIRLELEARGTKAHEHSPYATHVKTLAEHAADLHLELAWKMKRFAQSGATDNTLPVLRFFADLWGGPTAPLDP